jgi:hypothetical protein
MKQLHRKINALALLSAYCVLVKYVTVKIEIQKMICASKLITFHHVIIKQYYVFIELKSTAQN